jgi:hypothetical protein
MKKHILTTVIIFTAVLSLSYQVYADGFGIIMDVSDNVAVKRGGKSLPADIGSDIFSSDTVNLKQGEFIVIVSYKDCREWEISGPADINVTDEGPAVKGRNLTTLRRLPTCYSMEEFSGADSDVVGGLVFRRSDPMASLREEFDSGKATNSTLITLVMHALYNGDSEQARVYFDALKKRVPGSVLIKRLSKNFKE